MLCETKANTQYSLAPIPQVPQPQSLKFHCRMLHYSRPLLRLLDIFAFVASFIVICIRNPLFSALASALVRVFPLGGVFTKYRIMCALPLAPLPVDTRRYLACSGEHPGTISDMQLCRRCSYLH